MSESQNIEKPNLQKLADFINEQENPKLFAEMLFAIAAFAWPLRESEKGE